MVGFLGGLGMENGHCLLFGDGKAFADKAPVFFGFTHAAFFSYGHCLDCIEEQLDKVECRGEAVVWFVFDFER